MDLRLERDQLVADSTGAYFDDVTEDYGVDGNPDRNTLAVLVYAFLVDEDYNKTQVDIDNSTPETAARWFLPTDVDGWYELYILALDRWANDNGVTYTEHDVVHHNLSVYQCIVASTAGDVNPQTNPSIWKRITDITEILSDDDGTSDNDLDVSRWAVHNEGMVLKIEKGLGNHLINFTSSIADDARPKTKGIELLIYWVDLMGIYENFYREFYVEGAREIKHLTNKLKKFKLGDY